MNSLTLATSASANPMGAQRYDFEVRARASRALPDWTVREAIFRSIRSDLPGNRRAPMGWLARADFADRRIAGRVLFPKRHDILHRMDLVLPPGRGRNLVTIHDTVAWVFADELPAVAAAAEEARAADAVICVSAYTAGQVQDLLGVRDPIVVPNGVDDRFFKTPQLRSEDRSRLGLGQRYVLHSGGASTRKNLPALAAAWPLVHRAQPDVTLALLGPPHPNRTALFSGLAGVHLLGRQDDASVPAIVAAADIAVVPSTYEGFGLPALEAMAAGVPVVAAATSALIEVVGSAGVLVEPQPAAIAQALIELLSDERARSDLGAAGRLRAAEFTWERTVDGHRRVWESLS